MKSNRINAGWLMLLALSTLSLQPATALAQGSAFTYQGRLNDNGSPASGTYDLRFQVWDALTGGAQVGGPLTNSATGVANGLFTVTLDFGAGVFTGPARWLEVDVRTNGGGAFTALLPRQPLLPTPYAVMANTASNLLGTLPAAQLSGAVANGNLPASPTFSGTVTANSFSGSGASLTSLNANNLASGTVPLAQLSGIRSNQLDAATWQLATNLNGGNAALASNVVSGISITNAFITNSVFAGNGGGLTNLNAAQLTGTVPLAQLSGIRSNQLDAATWQLATNLNGGYAALATNVVAGLAITNAFITNSVFAGNGLGLTNLNAAQLTTNTVPLARLPSAVLTNNETGVTLGGTFYGYGAGLSNLNASQLTSGTVPLAQLPTAVVTNNSSGLTLNGTFVGSGTYLSNLTAANLSSGTVPLARLPGAVLTNNSTGVTLSGTLSGNGAGLTNLNLTGPSGNPSSANTPVGYQALYDNTTGLGNTAIGYQALYDNTTGNNNTANGNAALGANTNGAFNTAVGTLALGSNKSGSQNTANGVQALALNTTGADNTAIGSQALYNLKTGSGNIALGFQAGYNLPAAGANNIDIGNQGNSSDTNIIRIGSSQTDTYLAGTVHATGTTQPGVVGSSSTSWGAGVAGTIAATDGYGLFGQATNGTSWGLLARYGTDGNHAAYLGSSTLAADFYGDVHMNSTVTVSGTGTNTFNGQVNAAGGLVIETRNGSDPPSPATGQIWLRTDPNP